MRTFGDYASVRRENKAMQQLEITFLGTGTSHGIPVIGCECRVCHSPDPRDKRLRTSIQIKTPEMVIQVDTPPDFRTQCLREGVRQVDAVVYTHSHTDHILGFDDLRRFCEMEDRSMPLYAKERTMNDLRRVFAYAFDGNWRYRTYVHPEPVIFDGPFELGKTLITPTDLPHGQMITTGLVFSREGRKLLAYYTDCQEVPDEAVEAARGAEVLVIDALRHAPHTTHLTVEGALAAVAKIAPKKTYFIHMCHDLGHEETEKTLPENVRLAYDGLRITI